MDARAFGADGILDPGGAAAELAAWRGSIGRLAADTRAMSERLDQMRVTVAADDGRVTVTVDSSGSLTNLRLGRDTQRAVPDELARTILETIRAAKLQAAHQAQELLVETVGTESPAARGLVGRVTAQLLDDGLDVPDGATPEGRSGNDSFGWR